MYDTCMWIDCNYAILSCQEDNETLLASFHASLEKILAFWALSTHSQNDGRYTFPSIKDDCHNSAVPCSDVPFSALQKGHISPFLNGSHRWEQERGATRRSARYADQPHSTHLAQSC